MRCTAVAAADLACCNVQEPSNVANHYLLTAAAIAPTKHACSIALACLILLWLIACDCVTSTGSASFLNNPTAKLMLYLFPTECAQRAHHQQCIVPGRFCGKACRPGAQQDHQAARDTPHHLHRGDHEPHGACEMVFCQSSLHCPFLCCGLSSIVLVEHRLHMVHLGWLGEAMYVCLPNRLSAPPPCVVLRLSTIFFVNLWLYVGHCLSELMQSVRQHSCLFDAH
jgi:hypothetical protein